MATFIVFHHVFSSREIIGIGPLMSRPSQSQLHVQLYNTRQLFFQLHCSRQSIEISSDFFDLGFNDNTEEEFKKARADYRAYSEEYNRVRTAVVDLINSAEQEAAMGS